MHQINQRENSSSFLSYSLSSATSSTQLIHQNNNASYHTNSYDHQSQLIDQLPPMSTFASSQFVSNQPLLTSSHNFNELVIQNPNSEETLENAPFEMDTQSLDMVDMLTSPYDFDANTYLPDTPAIISNGLSESHDHYFGNALTSHEQPNHINHHELSFSNSLQNHLNLPIGQTQSVGEILASMDFSETETFLTDHYCSTDQNVSSNQNHNHNHNHNSVQQNSTIEQISQQQLPIQLPFTTNALTVNDPHLISHVVQITTVQASQPQPNCQFNHKNQLVIENTQTHIPNGLSLTSESRDKDEEYHFSGIVSNSSDIFANDITDLIEEVKCYKCKLCDFIHLKKEFISVHVHEKHKVDSNEKIDKNNKHKTVDSSKKPNSYLCCKCYQGFSTLESCRQHMVDLHNFKVDQVTLVSTSRNVNHDINSNESSESSNDKSKQMSKKLRHILPVTVKPFTMKKKQNNSKKINKKAINNNKNNNIESVNMNNLDNNDNESSIVNNNSNNNNSNNNTPNNNTPNNKVSKKIAWRKKMKRELGAYICEFKGCSVRFRSLENLQYHHKCHKDTGSGFACCNCGTKSENWASMAGHLWRSHNIDLELYACGHCNYRTYSLSMLENIHKRIHGDEKNFLCDICGKGFKNSKQLVNHKVIKFLLCIYSILYVVFDIFNLIFDIFYVIFDILNFLFNLLF